MFPDRRWISPYINRFLQPDSIIPGAANPQSWNRFSYAGNNPIRFNDPTGHMQEDDDYTCHACTPLPDPGGDNDNPDGDLGDDLETGSDDCASDDICLDIDTRDACNYINCPFWATASGMLGTIADTGAFLVNLPFAVAADIALLLTLLGVPLGPLGYASVVALYQLAAPVSNILGFAGLALWATQGFLTGESHLGMSTTLSSDLQLKESSISGSISQDTVFSALNDTLALSLKEPTVATIWSAVGVVYDGLRNPLAPYLSSADPIFPTVIQPNGSLTYHWQTDSFSGNFSVFPPSP